MKVLLAGYEDPTVENFKRLVSVMAFDPKFATDELAAERSRNAVAHPEHLQNFLDGVAKGFMNGPLAAFGRTAPHLSAIHRADAHRARPRRPHRALRKQPPTRCVDTQLAPRPAQPMRTLGPTRTRR